MAEVHEASADDGPLDTTTNYGSLMDLWLFKTGRTITIKKWIMTMLVFSENYG